jgi:hypothetical protein
MTEDTNGRYYLLYADLQKLIPPDDDATVSSKELDDIEEISRVVSEVTADRPRFCSST